MKQLSIVWILAWSLIAVPAVAYALAANQTAGVVEAATAIAQKAEPCECGTENNPGALEMLARFGGLGRTVVFSDGDAVFQPRKIERSGIRREVADRVLVHIHKERELECVERLFPAAHYVLIDDKLRILTALKQSWGPRVTTVFPRQGHYAHDPEILAGNPPADLSIAAIGDLLDYDLPTLLGAASGGAAAPRSPGDHPGDLSLPPGPRNQRSALSRLGHPCLV